MKYREILTWLLTLISTASDKLLPTIESIERMLDEVEKLISMWGTLVPQEAYEPLNNEETIAEQQVIEALQSATATSAIDMERLRNILRRANQLGIIDIIAAALVGKIPLPTNKVDI